MAVRIQNVRTSRFTNEFVVYNRQASFETVKLLDGEIVKEAEKVYVCKGARRKEMQTAKVWNESMLSGKHS